MRITLAGCRLAASLTVLHGTNAAVHRAETDISHSHEKPVTPDAASAEKNAFDIFNQLNSAGRQWGSSLQHNGVGFFPAIVPAGTLLYHGEAGQQPPGGIEWIAFEIEHAENFASSRLARWPQPAGGEHVKPGASDGQKPLGPLPPKPHGHPDEPDHPSDTFDSQVDLEFKDPKKIRGYLHTYQASRDLRLLYLDGMAAAKTSMGTMDSQDLVLCEDKVGNKTGRNFMGEFKRTQLICDMLKEHDYDGFVRMEIGFEIVYCDFSKGLELLSARRTFFTRDKAGGNGLQAFQWARAVAERYDGLGADRFKIDFSSMVSGWFFPINITNTDPERPDLNRLASAEQKHLQAVRSHVRRSLDQLPRFTVDWQATTDSIVRRYANRLAHMASPNISQTQFINEVETAVLTYIEAPHLPDDVNVLSDAAESIFDATARTQKEETGRCKEHFLLPSKKHEDAWELEDRLIYNALATVMRDICTVLISIRTRLINAAPEKRSDGLRVNTTVSSEQLAKTVQWSRDQIRHLVWRLGWAEWRKARRCGVDEVMFVPMWPFGQSHDFYHPGCRTSKFFDNAFLENSYWEEYNF